ncbi:MAG: BTAD domain-containing putative transcriptional regulator [Anaerolineae bacterium]
MSVLLRLDPLREKTYRQAMRLMAATGQREAALRQFEACQRILRDELGIAPAAHTVELAERIRRGEFSAPDPRPAALPSTGMLSHLPGQATSFVGRQAELAELLERLEDPDCRLLTIGGPGGIGKTRLALEVARRAAPRFANGVSFVPLVSVNSTEAMTSSVLSSLGMRPPETGPDLRAYLLNELASQSLLLVLDNMEHLLKEVGLIEAILEGAPGVRLLVTSRQPLDLEWEWYYPLEGLAVPTSATDTPETYSSVQLFAERARRARASFRLSDDPQGVVRICQRVEGMPLGIELAASWVRVMTCKEIAEEILGLETPYHTGEVRHHSLQALFENSWQRLSPREQELLMRLSVFRGGFTAAAAEEVAGAQRTDLAQLVQKSLIGLNYRTNRYEIHQLLVQFLRRKLKEQPDLEMTTNDAHSTYYMEFLRAREAELSSGSPWQALDDLRVDIENGRVAWAFALQQRRFDAIERSCTGLNTFFTLNVMHHDALGFFRRALEALALEPESTSRDRVELALQTCLIAPLTAVYGWEDRALWPVAERIRELAERLGNNQQVLTSLILLVDLYASNEWDRAVTVADEAVTFSKQHLGRQEQMAAHVLNELPLLFTGRLASALVQARSAQALFDPDNCLWATTTYGIDPLVISLSHAGIAQVMLGYADQGVRTLETAEARARTLGQPLALCFALAFDAISHLVTRNTARSYAAGETLIAMATEHGYAHWSVFGPCFRAVSLIQQGAYQDGIKALLPALEQEVQAGLTHNLPSWYAHLGVAYAMTGRLEQGIAGTECALATVERTGERYHESLAHRMQGELRRLAGDLVGAEASFEQAIRVAQAQESRFYELQALNSLYDLYESKGRAEDVRSRLQALCNWFTEGLDRPDLVEARQRLKN